MSETLQELNTNKAFSNQSKNFDEEDTSNPVIQRMRQQVQEHVLSLLKPGNKILELNAGTGIDAVFFASKGFDIVVTDNADGMLQICEQKINQLQLTEKIKIKKCSFNQLSTLQIGTFNHIFSNFGGLNCAVDITAVIKNFDSLLKPGGYATLVIMPPICPWELALALKGNFKIAFRRLKRGGVKSHLEGVYFNTYYYSPKKLIQAFDKTKFQVIKIKGLGVLSPPPYLNTFPLNHPKLYKVLCKIEEKIDERFPFNSWADHFIITMQKK